MGARERQEADGSGSICNDHKTAQRRGCQRGWAPLYGWGFTALPPACTRVPGFLFMAGLDLRTDWTLPSRLGFFWNVASTGGPNGGITLLI